MFKDLAGVASCLRSIAQDPEVAVLRVKNRLDPSYDARTSAGYRLLLSDLRTEQRKQLRTFDFNSYAPFHFYPFLSMSNDDDSNLLFSTFSHSMWA